MYRKFVYGNQKDPTIFFSVRNTFYANFFFADEYIAR